jgi:ABC-type oligopeptide transport system substrate-binding subunit
VVRPYHRAEVHGRLWLSSIGVAVGVAALVGAETAGTGASTRDAGRSAAARSGATLRVGRPFDVDSLDPALAYLSDTWTIEYATCAKLYNFRDLPAPAGALAFPEVAKTLPKVSQDRRTNTIVLNRTYRFHTGERITAASFVAAFTRDASPQMHSPVVPYLHEIEGADAVIAGQAGAISGVKALGRYKLQIRTTRPLPDLVSRLTMPFFCPIATSTPLREIDDPLGSGPYYVSSRVPNRQVVLKRNPFYRGPRRAHLGQIVWTIGVGGEACRVAIEQNEIDYCGGLGVPGADYAEIAQTYGINRKGGQFFSNPQLDTSYFAFNHDRPAFAGRRQIRLKRAINWALDRNALARAGGFLSGKPTDQILPPAIGRATTIYPVGGVTQASVSRARALLANARPTKLVLYAANGALAVARAQIFQFNLRRIGIDVNIKYFSGTELLRRTSTRGEAYDVVLQGWVADYPDGISFFSTIDGRNIRRTDNTNFAYFDRAHYNRRIAAIDRMRGHARRAAWADLDVELMRNDPPWAPFMNNVRRDFVSKSFGCYVFQPALSRVDLVAACKK